MTGKYLQNIKTCCKKVVKSYGSDRLRKKTPAFFRKAGVFLSSDSSERLHACQCPGANHHLHRKTPVLPSELKIACAILISQSDRQCFSYEDGMLCCRKRDVISSQSEPKSRSYRAACLNCYFLQLFYNTF